MMIHFENNHETPIRGAQFIALLRHLESGFFLPHDERHNGNYVKVKVYGNDQPELTLTPFSEYVPVRKIRCCLEQSDFSTKEQPLKRSFSHVTTNQNVDSLDQIDDSVWLKHEDDRINFDYVQSQAPRPRPGMQQLMQMMGGPGGMGGGMGGGTMNPAMLEQMGGMPGMQQLMQGMGMGNMEQMGGMPGVMAAMQNMGMGNMFQ